MGLGRGGSLVLSENDRPAVATRGFFSRETYTRERTREKWVKTVVRYNEDNFGEKMKNIALASACNFYPLHAEDPKESLIIRAAFRVRLREQRLTVPSGVSSRRRRVQ